MKKQITILSSDFNVKKIKTVKNSKNNHKPDGGLWTSSFNENYISDWFRFCALNDFSICSNGIPYILKAYIVKIKSNARIYRVNNSNDWINLVQTYFVKEIHSSGLETITVDYISMSKDYDIIHIKDHTVTRLLSNNDFPIFKDKFFARFPNYAPFDAESSCILNASIIDKVDSIEFKTSDFKYFNNLKQ